MKTETDICNLALTWLAADPIIALGEDTPEGKLCERLYADTRDVVMEDSDWSFAMRRQTLTPEVSTPDFGYSYQFTLPTTALRVVTVSDDAKRLNENTVQWVQEDNKILCDATTIYVRYLVQVTDPTKFSYSFCHALAARLAADMAIPLTESKSLCDKMFKLYDAKLSSAAMNDGRQGRSQKIVNRDLTKVR